MYPAFWYGQEIGVVKEEVGEAKEKVGVWSGHGQKWPDQWIRLCSELACSLLCELTTSFAAL